MYCTFVHCTNSCWFACSFAFLVSGRFFRMCMCFFQEKNQIFFSDFIPILFSEIFESRGNFKDSQHFNLYSFISIFLCRIFLKRISLIYDIFCIDISLVSRILRILRILRITRVLYKGYIHKEYS